MGYLAIKLRVTGAVQDAIKQTANAIGRRSRFCAMLMQRIVKDGFVVQVTMYES